jgi:formate dehydrogenase major subunit
VLLWGSNAREAHPIWFHHLLKGVRRGAKLFVVDPRRTASAQWAEGWLPVRVGSDISLANGMAKVILDEGLENREFLGAAVEGLEAYKAVVDQYPLDRVERETGVPAALVRTAARAFAEAPRAMICWTLGITEHHNAVDNVLSLINLALLCGHVGRWGSGLNPLRGQNNVQGGGDMGALPYKLPGFVDLENDAYRAQCEAAWGCTIPKQRGWTLTQMFEAMDHHALRALYVLGENPLQSEADAHKTRKRLEGLDFLLVQDLVLTKTAEMAHVVLPASASWCESEGTVTNSERRVQRVRRALDPPGEARDDLDILAALSKRLGFDMGATGPEQLWEELRSLSPLHRGMTWKRLEEHGGLQWPCPSLESPGEPFLHGRLWKRPLEGPKVRFNPAEHEGPVEALTPDYPLRLTTGRRLDSYNTGVATSAFTTPMRRGETVDLSPSDASALGVTGGERVRIATRRGAVEAPARIDECLPPGLVFMTFHFPDEVETNLLTIDASDPKAGTAEYKASAARVEKVATAARP